VFLLPLWEKVATGGLRPPSSKTPMLCIGYAKSATDEESLSASAQLEFTEEKEPPDRIFDAT
jgi:hypothetical protein